LNVEEEKQNIEE